MKTCPYNRVTNQNIESYEVFSKNPTISKVFREIGLADELGSGMRNTNKYTVLYSEEEPIFSEGDIFKTIIPLKNIATIRVGGDKPSIKTADKKYTDTIRRNSSICCFSRGVSKS